MRLSALADHDSSQKAERAGRPPVGRFAPTPSGRMHAGNIAASLCAWLAAKSEEGSIVLRIEDIDPARSKPCFADAIMRDFEYLGLSWDEGPYYQSDRFEAYREAYRSLVNRDLVYPCFCTRADRKAASAPHFGEKTVYPGTCRDLNQAERDERALVKTAAYRIITPDEDLIVSDALQGDYRQNLLHDCGDFIIRRSDGAFAYQLAVVVDDRDQGITSVVRGCDLLSSTPQQMYLQDLLAAPHPAYAHIPLFVTGDFRRLAKRDADAGIDSLIDRFGDARAIIGRIAGNLGLVPTLDPISPEELLGRFSFDALKGKVQVRWIDEG